VRGNPARPVLRGGRRSNAPSLPDRDVRPAKTQQKISGRLRSQTTTEHRYAIRGYLSTAAKHGADVMTAIRNALLGRAWMPPDPTPA